MSTNELIHDCPFVRLGGVFTQSHVTSQVAIVAAR